MKQPSPSCLDGVRFLVRGGPEAGGGDDADDEQHGQQERQAAIHDSQHAPHHYSWGTPEDLDYWSLCIGQHLDVPRRLEAKILLAVDLALPAAPFRSLR